MKCACGLEFEPHHKLQKWCTPKCLGKMWARAKYASEFGKAKQRDYTRQWRSGVTGEWVRELWERQGRKCAICGIFITLSAHLDHNHKTRENRGLLCGHCNVGVGMFKDDPMLLSKAIDYLNFYRG